MRLKLQKMISGLLVAGVAGALVAVLAAPADARVTQSNDEFCAVFSAQFPSIDFEGLGPDEAHLADLMLRQAAKTGVPAKVKKAMKKVAKVYARIADGEPAAEVLDAKGQKRILPALTRFSKYYAANCFATAPPT